MAEGRYDAELRAAACAVGSLFAEDVEDLFENPYRFGRPAVPASKDRVTDARREAVFDAMDDFFESGGGR